jgi:hypothetical protein
MRRGTSREDAEEKYGLNRSAYNHGLMGEIDQVRGDVPRVAWIRRELALAMTRQRPRPRKRDGKRK